MTLLPPPSTRDRLARRVGAITQLTAFVALTSTGLLTGRFAQIAQAVDQRRAAAQAARPAEPVVVQRLLRRPVRTVVVRRVVDAPSSAPRAVVPARRTYTASTTRRHVSSTARPVVRAPRPAAPPKTTSAPPATTTSGS